MVRRRRFGRRIDEPAQPDRDPSVLALSVEETGESESLVRELRAINEQLVVTSARQTELAEQAQRQAAQWNALLNSLNEGVIVVDATRQLVMVNPRGREILGLAAADEPRSIVAWGGTVFRHPHGGPIEPDDLPVARALRGDSFTNFETLVCRPNGGKLQVSFNGSAVRGENGEVILAICVFRDLTQLHRLEQAKEEYVALISHDLRGPLTNILGRADLLAISIARSAHGLEQDLKNVESIQTSARQMSAMIQDLVDTARLESGSVVGQATPTDIVAVVRDVFDGMLSVDEQTRTRVEIGTMPASVLVDRDRIQRVVMNLLRNALKYSPSDHPVVIHVGTEADHVVVAVADQGIGVSPEDQTHLFEKYYRGGATQTSDGLGLGLYIARLIVEAAGGRIWAISELGQGSKFGFSLPIQPAQQEI